MAYFTSRSLNEGEKITLTIKYINQIPLNQHKHLSEERIGYTSQRSTRSQYCRRNYFEKNHSKVVMSSVSKQGSTCQMSISIKTLIICIVAVILSAIYKSYSYRMVRLCIASVDPVKLSSQCVMCNRREFPLIAIDCTGLTKMNYLISNPLSVQEATCLIYNCRRQIPDIKPEPYYGSVSHAARANYPSASGTRSYEMMPPSGMVGRYSGSPSVTHYSGFSSSLQDGTSISSPSSLTSSGGFVGGSNAMMHGRQQALPYALVPTSYTSPFGKFRFTDE